MSSYNISNYIQAPFNAIASDVNFLLFSQIGSQVVQLFGVIDAIPEEQHQLTVETTDYPIETGATLTDHAYIKPTELNILGYVSGILVPKFSTLVTKYRDREAWERIILQIQKRELVTVFTTLTSYKNMIITSVNTRKSDRVGSGSLVFKMSLKNSLVAETQTADLSKDQITGAADNKSSVVNGGSKQSSSLTSAKAQSWLGSALGIIT